MHGNKLHDIRLTISLPRDDDPSIVALCIYIHKTLGSSWTLSVESDDGKRGADEQVRRATALRPELHGTEAEGSQLHGCALPAVIRPLPGRMGLHSPICHQERRSQQTAGAHGLL